MLILAVGLFIVIGLAAVVEINVEGEHGWAENLPTWYRVTGPGAWIWGKIMNGKPLTGYHPSFNLLLLSFFHLRFFQDQRWPTAVEELGLWSQFLAMGVYWDFAWFLLNPCYLSKDGVGFSKRVVWWHALSHWVAELVPTDYVMGIFVSLLAAVASSTYTSWTHGWIWETQAVKNQLLLIAWLGLFTTIAALFAPLYHRYYWYMRRKDDRNLVDKFHKDSLAARRLKAAFSS